MSKPSLNIIADANMPQAAAVFSALGKVQLVPGRSITRQTLQTADVLLVRSVTAVTAQLLAGTPVKFVGTATAGIDHIEPAIQTSKTIGFSAAKGANANSVVEYVLACVAHRYIATGVDALAAPIGIVGAGCVGSALAKTLTVLGGDVRVYDPFVKCHYGRQVEHLLELQQCALLSVHTPYTADGAEPTRRLINWRFLEGLPKAASLIAAGRGDVVEEAAAITAIEQKNLHYYADVWANEPVLAPATLTAAVIATPHVAGYSVDGKVAATQHLYGQVCRHFGWQEALPNLTAAPQQTLLADSGLSGHAQFYEVLSRAWDVAAYDTRLRAAVAHDNSGKAFDDLRAAMQGRYEFSNYTIQGLDATAAKLAAVVGFGVV